MEASEQWNARGMQQWHQVYAGITCAEAEARLVATSLV